MESTEELEGRFLAADCWRRHSCCLRGPPWKPSHTKPRDWLAERPSATPARGMPRLSSRRFPPTALGRDLTPFISSSSARFRYVMFAMCFAFTTEALRYPDGRRRAYWHSSPRERSASASSASANGWDVVPGEVGRRGVVGQPDPLPGGAYPLTGEVGRSAAGAGRLAPLRSGGWARSGLAPTLDVGSLRRASGSVGRCAQWPPAARRRWLDHSLRGSDNLRRALSAPGDSGARSAPGWSGQKAQGSALVWTAHDRPWSCFVAIEP